MNFALGFNTSRRDYELADMIEGPYVQLTNRGFGSVLNADRISELSEISALFTNLISTVVAVTLLYLRIGPITLALIGACIGMCFMFAIICSSPQYLTIHVPSLIDRHSAGW